MSVSGLCQICEARQAEHHCERCGQLVCAVHYEPEYSVCADCAAEMKPGELGDTETYRY